MLNDGGEKKEEKNFQRNDMNGIQPMRQPIPKRSTYTHQHHRQQMQRMMVTEGSTWSITQSTAH